MTNASPYEIRLELLKMAKEMLSEDYCAQREQINENWATQVEFARHSGTAAPNHPGYPLFPTEAEIITKATALNSFVSQIPVEIKTKKSG